MSRMIARLCVLACVWMALTPWAASADSIAAPDSVPLASTAPSAAATEGLAPAEASAQASPERGRAYALAAAGVFVFGTAIGSMGLLRRMAKQRAGAERES